MTHALPRGWQLATLGELCAPRKGKYIPSAGDQRPYLSLDNIAGEVGRIDGWECASDYRSQSVELSPGDVAYARLRPYLNKVAIADREALGSAELIVLPPSDALIPAFLQYQLLSSKFVKFAQSESTGDRPRLKWNQMRHYPLAVPPLAEQERIVATIEQHFTHLDAIQSTLERGLRSVTALRTSLLTEVFMVGRTLPHNWELRKVGDVANVQLGRQRSPEHHSGPELRPYLRAANVTWDGINIEDVKEMNFDTGDFETYRLQPGDLLLNEASGSPNEVGKPAVWNGEIEGCCFQNTLLRLQARDINPGYLYWYCYMAASTGRFGEAGRGVNIRHLGKQGLAQFPIRVAPKGEQECIVTQLETQFQQSSDCETSIRRALERANALRRSILAKAFSGQLSLAER